MPARLDFACSKCARINTAEMGGKAVIGFGLQWAQKRTCGLRQLSAITAYSCRSLQQTFNDEISS